MKVIKVGTSSQSRIAQACDRCRSKKIRCDGIRPCCTQCANVGFECRTSDKLSRRAFPRGYTESLEERVRVLEAEVRDLKDLLDEKDEKIDMLSKMHGNNGQVRRRMSSESAVGNGMAAMASPMGSPVAVDARTGGKEPTPPPPPKEDVFRVQASPLLLGVENSDSYYMGPSSGRGFIGESSSAIYVFLVKSASINRICRGFQAQTPGIWKTMHRLQHRSLPAHPRLLSPGEQPRLFCP